MDKKIKRLNDILSSIPSSTEDNKVMVSLTLKDEHWAYLDSKGKFRIISSDELTEKNDELKPILETRTLIGTYTSSGPGRLLTDEMYVSIEMYLGCSCNLIPVSKIEKIELLEKGKEYQF